MGRKGAEVREGVAMDPTKFGRKLTPMALRHQTRHRIELMCVLCDVFVLRIIFFLNSAYEFKKLRVRRSRGGRLPRMGSALFWKVLYGQFWSPYRTKWHSL